MAAQTASKIPPSGKCSSTTKPSPLQAFICSAIALSIGFTVKRSIILMLIFSFFKSSYAARLSWSGTPPLIIQRWSFSLCLRTLHFPISNYSSFEYRTFKLLKFRKCEWNWFVGSVCSDEVDSVPVCWDFHCFCTLISAWWIKDNWSWNWSKHC